MVAYSYVLDAFAALGVQVVGLSVDSAADAAATRKRLQVDVPLVGDLAYPDSVDALGAYRNEDRQSHQASAFALDADRRVEHAVYSATNVGRLMPEEVLRILS